MKVLIKSAKIIDVNSKNHNKILDVLIDDGKIIKISKNISEKVSTVFTESNLHISTGWMDISTIGRHGSTPLNVQSTCCLANTILPVRRNVRKPLPRASRGRRRRSCRGLAISQCLKTPTCSESLSYRCSTKFVASWS